MQSARSRISGVAKGAKRVLILRKGRAEEKKRERKEGTKEGREGEKKGGEGS